MVHGVVGVHTRVASVPARVWHAKGCLAPTNRLLLPARALLGLGPLTLHARRWK